MKPKNKIHTKSIRLDELTYQKMLLLIEESGQSFSDYVRDLIKYKHFQTKEYSKRYSEYLKEFKRNNLL